ncbi:MAG: hypothetical protein ACTSVY_10920, partial [Candidatus Helarchaeota archaeon]
INKIKWEDLKMISKDYVIFSRSFIKVIEDRRSKIRYLPGESFQKGKSPIVQLLRRSTFRC